MRADTSGELDHTLGANVVWVALCLVVLLGWWDGPTNYALTSGDLRGMGQDMSYHSPPTPKGVMPRENRVARGSGWGFAPLLRAEESQRRETEARGRIQVLETQLQGLGDDLDATRAKTPEAEQSLVMTRSALEKVESSLAGRPGVLSARYPQLEIEEDPYATFSEDDNLPMEAKVSFDDSDPPAI
ncbi:hypothetical protein B296_00048830 [Ensete ventricosum]|uniref:Uncharacterized protein n=1 Tax=Ensete ventricosum TaxID=4639 RepID=A0A426YFV4_ENSVE|nr:hypothetical protein B296_00048830 [Ensete ventricosum]